MDDKRSFRQRCRQPVPYKTPQFTMFACEKHFVEVFKKGGTGEVIASAPTRSARFEQMSIDQLAEQLDRHVDEPLELRIIEEVLKSKIGAMVKEAGQSPEPELDGRTCPSAINSPSTASFESVTPRGDSNRTEKHVDLFGAELKPPPAPNRERRWAPDHVLAVPSADVVGLVPIHSDGTQANTFVGDVPTLPGVKVSFNNPGRSA